MRGAVLLGGRQVVLKEFPDPEPGPGEVVMRTRASGLCGSELHSLYRPPREQRQRLKMWGYIGGYEPAGTIDQIGPGVEGLEVGDRVMVYHIQGCGYCRYCRSGWMLHCPVVKKSSIGPSSSPSATASSRY